MAEKQLRLPFPRKQPAAKAPAFMSVRVTQPPPLQPRFCIANCKICPYCQA